MYGLELGALQRQNIHRHRRYSHYVRNGWSLLSGNWEASSFATQPPRSNLFGRKWFRHGSVGALRFLSSSSILIVPRQRERLWTYEQDPARARNDRRSSKGGTRDPFGHDIFRGMGTTETWYTILVIIHIGTFGYYDSNSFSIRIYVSLDIREPLWWFFVLNGLSKWEIICHL